MSTQTSVETNMVHLKIDEQEVAVPKGTTIYQAAKQMHIDIPIFCYQDRMPPFGACRMCLVEVEKMAKLQTACTCEVVEGMVVKTQSTLALDGREGILEFLLINHPLDCPICDRGGECPLQDNTLKHGPGRSRFFETKRHFKKALSLGPVLKLDRERCIACARCTRFSDIIAGDHALEFIERGHKTEVGTPNGDPVESKFIGNTIQICPVGALTSQVYRFRARPWDNTSTESTCTLCPVGCSLTLDSRDGSIMRTRAHENIDVNDMWLCDKGWFGYEFTDHEQRLKHPLIRRKGQLEKATWDEALTLIATKIKESMLTGKLAGLGGNTLTVEENYLFQKLIREGGSVNNIDHRVGMSLLTLEEEGMAPGMELSIGECEKLSHILILGLDLTEEFPVIWLRLKQAINRGAKVTFVGHFAPEVVSHLTQCVVHPPGNEMAMLHTHLLTFTNEIAGKEERAAIFVGSQYLATPYRLNILSELASWRKSHANATLNLMEGSGNSFGARFAGMRPDMGPMGAPLNKKGLNVLQILENAARSGWDLLYVAGTNPVTHVPSKLWAEARAKLGCLVVQDLFLNETARQADIILPSLSFIEKEGSFINIEGRVQKLKPGKAIPVGLHSDAEIFTMIGEKLNLTMGLDTHFTDQLNVTRLPLRRYEKVDVESIKVVLHQTETLVATFARALFDHSVRMKHSLHLIQLAKEPRLRMHPLEGAKLGIQEGSTVQVKSSKYSFITKVKLDERVSIGVVVIPVGFKEIPAYELDAQLMNGLAIQIERV